MGGGGGHFRNLLQSLPDQESLGVVERLRELRALSLPSLQALECLVTEINSIDS